jgi:hypothetical protein
MIARFFSALGGIVAIFSFFVLLISYANYPDEVLVNVNNAGEPLTYLSKSLVFYIALVFFILTNITLIGLRRILKNQPIELPLSPAGLGLTQIFFNLFLASSVYFIGILNSHENFNYSNFGYLIYVTAALFMLAIIFTLISRFILKK